MQTKISSDKKEVIIGHDQPVVAIGERINPTGRSKLATALEEGDFGHVKNEALKQVE
ncbi:MAG: methyltetrahydrofolate cobalamin methyltransferase, partial [Gammaproteobacteria bacterium]|nr:methyltetrahydrofolate cobalamin methyltransferase [Gammaproteobacteria bacterium]